MVKAAIDFSTKTSIYRMMAPASLLQLVSYKFTKCSLEPMF